MLPRIRVGNPNNGLPTLHGSETAARVIRLANSLTAWGTPGFEDILKQELEHLRAGQLPLQQGLMTGSYALDDNLKVLIHTVSEEAGFIRIRAGIFYAGIIAGCSCADDLTLVDEQNEYCEVRIDINKQTGETTISLLADLKLSQNH